MPGLEAAIAKKTTEAIIELSEGGVDGAPVMGRGACRRATDKLAQTPWATKLVRTKDDSEDGEYKLGGSRAIQHPTDRVELWAYVCRRLILGHAEAPGSGPIMLSDMMMRERLMLTASEVYVHLERCRYYLRRAEVLNLREGWPKDFLDWLDAESEWAIGTHPDRTEVTRMALELMRTLSYQFAEAALIALEGWWSVLEGRVPGEQYMATMRCRLADQVNTRSQ